MHTPRASSLSHNPNANPNNNGQGSQWGLLTCDNNEWKRELDETNIFLVKKFYEP